jgi:hypothetical protein
MKVEKERIKVEIREESYSRTEKKKAKDHKEER